MASSRFTVGLVLAVALICGASVVYFHSRQPAPEPPAPPSQPETVDHNDEAAVSNAEPERPASAAIRFTSMLRDSGIDFVHNSGTSPEKPFPAANGSGVATLDYDQDGLCDVYFATGTPFPVDTGRDAPTNRCYRNLGDWKFTDVSAHTGLDHAGYTAGVAVGDFDNDGFPDVFLGCYGANVLYRNQGDGTYQPVTDSAINDDRWAASAAFFDYDNDGSLDLYVCHYGKWTLETNQFCGDRERNVRNFCSPKTVEPKIDLLLHNEGDGTFRDVSSESGIDVVSRRGQGVIAVDVNDDRLIDIYVGNDIHPNSLFINLGPKEQNGRVITTFEDASETSGTAYDGEGKSQAGMGVAAADINHNGMLDLFVTNFESEHNTLYSNAGNVFFSDNSRLTGVASSAMPWVGWGTAFVDFDGDGWQDLVVTNGHVDDNLAELGREGDYEQPALLFRNNGGRFELIGDAAGAYFADQHCGRGLAIADLDNDGDPDLVIGHQDAPPALLRNDSPGLRKNRTTIRLVGVQCNRDAIGTRIFSNDSPRLDVACGGGSYLSASELRLFAATGDTSAITWPLGSTMSRKLVNPATNSHIFVQVDQR